jgi:predicted ATPase
LVPDLPSDLDELCARLLRFDPALRPTDRQMLRATGSPPDRVAKAFGSATMSLGVPFVGRELELGSLRAAYEHVRETGRALTVLVRGESGIGKSCLVRHFTDLLATDDMELLVFSGRCYEREAVPYKALDGVIDEIARFLGRMRAADLAQYLPTRPAPLIKVFPALRRIEAVAQMRHPSEAPVDVHELRARAFAAVRELISRLAARRPLIIVIDDLQWADEDSLALLQALIRGPEEPNVLFIATIRDAAEATTATRIGRDPEEAIPGEVRKIVLARLGKKDAHDLAARLVERVAPGIPLSVDTLAEEADGHPLFLDEIVRHLFSVGAPQGTLRLEEALWGV